MTFVAADLLPVATALKISDHLSSIYKRLAPMVGASADVLSSDLAGAITASATSFTMDASFPATAPPSFLVTIDKEDIWVVTWATNTASVVIRGQNGTTPAAHADEATVYFPASAAGYALQIETDILGDGSTVYGIGSPHSQVVIDLLPALLSQLTPATLVPLLNTLVAPWIKSWNQHISNVAPAVLLTAPSYGGQPPADFSAFCRYYNDVVAGTPFSCLVDWRMAYLYWLVTGDLLDNKSVIPAITKLASGVMSAGPVVTPTLLQSVNRYGVSGSPWTQGYAAQAIQARCTVVGNGTVSLSMTAEGQKTDGTYFNRSGINGGDSGTTADPDTATHTFTNATPLDLTTVGNVQPMLNGGTGERVLKALTLARTGGTATTGTFVIETVPDRFIV